MLPRIPRFTPYSKDPQLAPPVQRVRRRLRPSPHPGVHWLDGAPFQETALGHSGQWDR